MELLDLITDINRYCVINGIKTTQVTVSELTNEMLIEYTKETK